MNKEQAEAAARVIMEAETRKLVERQARTARRQEQGALRKRMLLFAALGYFASLVAGKVFDWSAGPSGLVGFVLGMLIGWWTGRKRATHDEVV